MKIDARWWYWTAQIFRWLAFASATRVSRLKHFKMTSTDLTQIKTDKCNEHGCGLAVLLDLHPGTSDIHYCRNRNCSRPSFIEQIHQIVLRYQWLINGRYPTVLIQIWAASFYIGAKDIIAILQHSSVGHLWKVAILKLRWKHPGCSGVWSFQ